MNVLRGASETFKLKSRLDYEKLIKAKIYTKACIRIKFPNEVLLQSNFAVMETVGDIYNFIRENLSDPNLEFYITTSPPLKKYTDMNATIFKEGLAPTTLMYINFPSIDPKQPFLYLKEETTEKYRTEFKI